MIIALIHIILIISVLWLIPKPTKHLNQKWFWVGWLWRVALGMAFGYVYLIWLNLGDTIYFFQEGSSLAREALNNPSDYIDHLLSVQYPDYKSEARNTFFIKIVSLFSLVTRNNYWLITLWFATLSYLTVWFFLTSIVRFYPTHKGAILFGVMFFPSPIFWTSGLLKDTIVFASFLMAATITFRYFQKRQLSILEISGLLLSLYLIWKLRYFVFALSVIGILILLFQLHIVPLLSSKRSKIIFWVASVTITVLGSTFLSANLNLTRLPTAIYDNYQQMVALSDEGKTFSFDLAPTWVSIILNAPKALLSGIFLPITGSNTLIYFPFGFENLFLIMAFLFCLHSVIRNPIMLNTPAILLVGFTLVCACLFPLAAPNIGTFMRYKAIYLPFIIYFLGIPISQLPLFHKH